MHVASEKECAYAAETEALYYTMRPKNPTISVGYLFPILTKLCNFYVIIKCWEIAHHSLNCQGDWSSHTFPPLCQAIPRNTSSKPFFQHKHVLKIDFLSYGNVFVSAVNRPIVNIKWEVVRQCTSYSPVKGVLQSGYSAICYILHCRCFFFSVMWPFWCLNVVLKIL